MFVEGTNSNKSKKYEIYMGWNASELGFPRVNFYEEWDLGPLIIALGLGIQTPFPNRY